MRFSDLDNIMLSMVGEVPPEELNYIRLELTKRWRQDTVSRYEALGNMIERIDKLIAELEQTE